MEQVFTLTNVLRFQKQTLCLLSFIFLESIIGMRSNRANFDQFWNPFKMTCRLLAVTDQSQMRKVAFTGFAFVFATFLFTLSGTSESHAESRQCRKLRVELASLDNASSPSSGKSSAEYRRYSRYAKQQSAALKGARRDAVAQGCLTRSGKKTSGGAAVCPALVSKIGKMRRNLASLTKKRDQLSASSDVGRTARTKSKRRKIQAKMIGLRCGEEIETAGFLDKIKRKKVRKRGFLSRLFGIRRKKSRYSAPPPVEIIEPKPEKRAFGGVYRTLCVRVCDGFYFPVSFATVRDAFDADDAFCQASNPSTEMRLFVHKNPSQDSEDMVDLDGEPYTALPNAFLYRTTVADPKICPRRPAPSAFIQIAGGDVDEELADLNPGLFTNANGDYEDHPGVPIAKPDFFVDPDTHMAKVGKFSLKPVNEINNETLAEEVAAISYDPNKVAESGIRVVGPTFLDDQESVELLLTPDQIEVQ